MSASELTFWNSGVWVIPIILLSTVAALFVLVRYWQLKTQQNLKELRKELRRYQNSRRELAIAAQEHSIDDPEPYGSRMAALHQQLDEVGKLLTDLERQHVAIQERSRFLSSRRWEVTVGGPYFWYLLRKDVLALRQRIADSQVSLDNATGFRQTLARLGWEVALEARQVQDTYLQVSRLLEQLRAENVRGATIETALRQVETIKTSLAKIPGYFLTADEESILAQADKENIARVHKIIEETRPQLIQLLAQAQAWEKLRGDAVSRVTLMRQSLSNLEQSLGTAPAGLDLDPLNTKYNQLKVISDNLHATLSRLEVENMPEVAKEAGRVNRAALEMDNQLKQSRQQLSALETILPELSVGLKTLSGQFADLSKNPIHPVRWSKSKPLLTQVSQQVNTLGPVTKARTPEQVGQDLAVATKLSAQQKELIAYCQQVAQQHSELLTLLGSPELSQGLEWCRKTYVQAERMQAYDSENWPCGDGVQTLSNDLRQMAENLKQSLVAADPAEQVDETEVTECLEDTRQLAQALQALQARVENMNARFDEVQQTEKLAGEQLETGLTSLGQTAFLVRSNDLLIEVAGPDVTRAQKELQGLQSELEQHERGTADRKAKQVSAALAKTEQDANQWIDKLNKDIAAQVQEISATLAALDAIAQLDEPALQEARRLLASSPAFLTSGDGQKPNFKLDGLVTELKRRSDYWQACMACIRALEDVKSHVIETYHIASQNRQAAKEMFTEIANWMRSTRGWPPTSVTLNSERQELARVEGQWDDLKNQPVKALALVAQLGNLAAKYQSIGERASQAAQRADREQAQIEELEGELNDLAQQWQDQMQAHRENPLAMEEIRKLLDEIDRELDQIRRQSRQGSRNYSQVLQAIQALHRKVRTRQVAIDASHVLDINGRVIAYR